MSKKTALYFFILCCHFSFAQIKKERDSAKLYQKIEKFSNKTKFGKFFHELIFESTNRVNSNPIKKSTGRFATSQKKIIRKINIITLDPFGFSEIDDNRKPTNTGEKLGNFLHIKSNKNVIRDFLLFKENQILDSLLLKESERLIRTQNFINTVYISTNIISAKNDSIDITVRVLDSWSFVPSGSVSQTQITYNLNEKNLLGTGHTAEYENSKLLQESKNAEKILYIIPNFENTFIRSTFLYQKDLLGNINKNIVFERPFFSPLTKWAGGAFVGQTIRSDSLQNVLKVSKPQTQNVISQDYWIGRSFRIFNNKYKDARNINLIVSARLFSQHYVEKPTLEFDPLRYFSDEIFVLSGIGVSKRLFIEDKYIFKNGIIEDVPIGLIYGITNGYQFKNARAQYYFGAKVSYGDYFKFGYFSTNFEFGSLYNKGISNQSTLVFQVNYFTNLQEIGRWKIRQFIKPQLVVGNNRLASNFDRLNINDNFGIQGFDSKILGTKKIILTLQTQAYSPRNLAGFRLNPYLNYSMAVLGNENNGFSKSTIYSKIGIGLNINNDFLVFSAFQVSFSYYPLIPGIGENIFRTNGFTNSDFGFQSFDFAKPTQAFYK